MKCTDRFLLVCDRYLLCNPLNTHLRGSSQRIEAVAELQRIDTNVRRLDSESCRGLPGE